MIFDESIYRKIEDYLRNEMTNDEVKAFEKELYNNKELAQEVDIHRKMNTIYSSADWLIYDGDKQILTEAEQLFKSDDVKEFKKHLKESKNTYKSVSKFNFSRVTKYMSSIAAVGLIIFASYQFFFSNPSSHELYDSYYSAEDLPSFTVKSDENNQLAVAERFFKTKNYPEALAIFKEIDAKTEANNPNITLYLALIYSELNNYDTALQQLDTLEKSNNIDYHKAYWFKSLVYLKQDKKDKAIETLKIILNDEKNFNYSKTKKLLNQLE